MPDWTSQSTLSSYGQTRRTRRHTSLYVIGLLIATTIACSNLQGPQCRMAEGCKNGKMCALGWCQAPNQIVCKPDGRCPTDHSCTRGVCIRNGNPLTCTRDSACLKYYRCHQGVCICGIETCNGHDDDCDGQIDEGIINCVSTVAVVPSHSNSTFTRANLSIAPDGTLYAASGGMLLRIDASGSTEPILDTTSIKARGEQPGGPYGLAGLAIDKAGTIYLSDARYHRILKVDKSGNITTFAGDGRCRKDSQTSRAIECYRDGPALTAQFHTPTRLALDKEGNLYVADTDNHRIRKIDTVGNVTTFAGNGTQGYKDGPAQASQFSSPSGMAFDSDGNLYVADSRNHRIRKIDTAGTVTTFAGGGGGGPDSPDGQGINAEFFYPKGLTFDPEGNLYVADSNNYNIRKITRNGYVSTFAGLRSFRMGKGTQDGQGQSAKFYYPHDIVWGPGQKLYVTDGDALRTIDSSALVTTLAKNPEEPSARKLLQAFGRRFPVSFQVSSPNEFTFFVPHESRIFRIDKDKVNNWRVVPFAGSSAGYKDGAGANAQFSSIAGLAMGGDGNLYAADLQNHRIRKIDTSGVVTTFAGSGDFGERDGSASSAQFIYPRSLLFDRQGNLHVEDQGNQSIRRIDKTGTVSTWSKGQSSLDNAVFGQDGKLYISLSTKIHKLDQRGNLLPIAGTGEKGHTDGPASSAQFTKPGSLALDADDNLYIADGNAIRKLGAGRKVTTLAGSQTPGYRDDQGANARFGTIRKLVLGPKGDYLYIIEADAFDAELTRIRRMKIK